MTISIYSPRFTLRPFHPDAPRPSFHLRYRDARGREWAILRHEARELDGYTGNVWTTLEGAASDVARAIEAGEPLEPFTDKALRPWPRCGRCGEELNVPELIAHGNRQLADVLRWLDEWVTAELQNRRCPHTDYERSIEHARGQLLQAGNALYGIDTQ